jgi:hypothetical protein
MVLYDVFLLVVQCYKYQINLLLNYCEESQFCAT